MTRRIDGIAFDFGRVLANFDHLISCEQLAKYSALPAAELVRLIHEGCGQQHERGEINSLEFYWQVRKLIGTNRLTYADFRKFWNGIFSPNRGVEKVLARIDPTVRTCIVSNTDPIHWSAIEQLPVMQKYFGNRDRLIRSFDIGERKPHVKMWESAQSVLDCPPDRILYIDDMPEYVLAARQFGFHAVQYDCSQPVQFPLSYLADTLQKYGALAK